MTPQRDTLDGRTSIDYFNLQSHSSDIDRFNKETVPIPIGEHDVVEMDQSKFKQYVVQITEGARLLVLQALKESEDTKMHINEWSMPLEDVNDESADIEYIFLYVSDKIESIDALQLFSPSTKISADFDNAKKLLEEMQTKLKQWISFR